MSFAQAYAKAAAKKGQKVDNSLPQKTTETDPEQVPMMYRTQVQGRCSLQHAGNNQDLEDWTKEWVNPQRNGQPFYQRPQPELGLDGWVYRLSIQFPFRISTN
jgi:CRISPR-associated protein Cmr6